jgi:hypothetical protein
MAVGKGSIKRAAKAVDSTVAAAPAKEVVEAIVEKAPAEKAPAEKKPAAKKAPAKKPAAKKAPAKKAAEKVETPDKNAPVAIGKALPPHLL